MARIVTLLAVTFLALAPAARADTQLLISGVPDEYTPGQSFTFEVQLAGSTSLLHLVDFNLALSITASNPGSLTVGADKPADLDTFVFQDNPSSVLLSNIGLTETTLTVSIAGTQTTDPDGPPAQPQDVQIGFNDVLALVTVNYAVDFPSALTISIDKSLTTLDTGNEPLTFTVQGSSTTNPTFGGGAVPTPASWMMMGFGSVVLLAGSRRARRTALA